MADSRYFLRWCLGLQSSTTQTSLGERAALANAAAGRKFIVEIGVFHGVNTLAFRRVMSEDGLLWAVDPFFPGRVGICWAEILARRNVARSRRGTVSFIKQLGKDAVAGLASINSRPDFIFIDGDHSWDGVKGDWEAWSGALAMGGVVAFHDSVPAQGVPLFDSVRYVKDVVSRDPRYTVRKVVETTTFVERTGI